MLPKIALLLCLLAGTKGVARPLNVIVDPGHGGSDAGATRGALRESELVLLISQQLISLLKADPKFIVHTTRVSDVLVTLDERTQFAEQKKADVFISVHANSSPVSYTRGVEIYFQNQIPADMESLYLANRENQGAVQNTPIEKSKGDLATILDDLHHQNQIYQSSILAKEVFRSWERKKTSHLHIRQAPFHVLAETKIPSILVETGFITNDDDRRLLQSPQHHLEIAQIIYQGIQSYRQKLPTEL